MPAQRRPRKRKRQLIKLSKRPIIYLASVLIFSLFFAILIFASKYWNGEDKVSVVINKGEGGLMISVFDPTLDEITNLIVPPETLVTTSRQLGDIRAKNVWQLGINEDIGGKLLSETIRHTFSYPTIVWADSPASGLSQKGYTKLVAGVFTPYKTNLSFSDKVRIALFNLRVENKNRVEIDLGQTPVLRKTVLRDGNSGYVTTEKETQNITSIFSDPEFAERGLRISLIDNTASATIGEDVTGVVETMGAKVVSVKNADIEDFDCEVYGNDEYVRVFSRVFECKVLSDEPDGNFDLVISLGEKFVRRY